MTRWTDSKWLRLTAVSVIALAGVLWACEVEDEDDASSERTTKAEFIDARNATGASNIDSVTAPGSATVDLSSSGGSRGFYVEFTPGQALLFSVFGSAAVTYFPEFSPGFDFLDTAPGTTRVTNIDEGQGNAVLVVVEGTGEVDFSVSEAE